MADKRISALTAATTLDKTEVFPIVQGGVTVKATIAQALAPLTVLQSDAGTMLAGVPAYPVDGQVYLLTSLGITGVDHIRTVGIVDANTADFVFNNNCEAYLDGLGIYVPCTYDVVTNDLTLSEISKKIIIPSASVQSMGTTPVMLIQHIGGWRADITSFVARNIIGGTPFDLTLDLSVAYSGLLAPPLFLMVNFFAADLTVKLISTTATSGSLELLGEDIVAFESNGFDSSVGDGSVEINLTYKYIIQ